MKIKDYIRPIITLAWTGVILYCLVTGKPLSEWEKTLYIGVVTYYFAEKAALKRPEEG